MSAAAQGISCLSRQPTGVDAAVLGAEACAPWRRRVRPGGPPSNRTEVLTGRVELDRSRARARESGWTGFGEQGLESRSWRAGSPVPPGALHGGDRAGPRQRPGTPGADPVRALDRPGVHHGCTVPVRVRCVHRARRRIKVHGAARAGPCRRAGKVTAASCACLWCPPGHANPPSPVKAVLLGVSLWRRLL